MLREDFLISLDIFLEEDTENGGQLPNPKTIHELYTERLYFVTEIIEDDR